MKQIFFSHIIVIAALILIISGCKKDDDAGFEDNPASEKEADTVIVNVDVILPAYILPHWKPTIDWAMENIQCAQDAIARKVVLNLRYHDEDTEDLDKLGYSLTYPAEGDDTCHAIIGPYHSSNADKILRYAGRNRLPVIMPTCTGSELQRTNARNTYAWFLTESDITQCEIMLAAVKAMKLSNVALIYTDDTYGQSFRDWFGYYAAENNLTVSGDGMCTYEKGKDMSSFLKTVFDDCEDHVAVVYFALSEASLYSEATEALRSYVVEYNEQGSGVIACVSVLTDVALDESVINREGLWYRYGICPTGALSFGFPQSFEAKFGKYTLSGHAQIYDALTMIALGAAHQSVNGERCIVAGQQVSYKEPPLTPGLTDHMRSVVSSEEGVMCGWNIEGLARAFGAIDRKEPFNVIGATGTLNFDTESYTKILNTNYMIVTPFYIDKPFVPLIYLNTAGSNTQASTTSMWEVEKKSSQAFNTEVEAMPLPDLRDRWAVVISPSTTWSNYRHQADAFAMYQLLLQHGYDDDHIVLIVEDNLANDINNKAFPGKIFVERSDDASATDMFVNDDVRNNAVVDYHFSDLTPDDIADIMLGNSSSRLPHVIKSDENSDVFFFWSGHGGSHDGPLWGNEDASQYFGSQRMYDIVEQMMFDGKYRRMFFAIETCYSGKWGEALENLPEVLVMTAATPYETSKADMYDKQLGVYLSNAFARTFRRQINNNTQISIYNLYRELFKTTKGSHVSIYNNDNYGSVYQETMEEYFGTGE